MTNNQYPRTTWQAYTATLPYARDLYMQWQATMFDPDYELALNDYILAMDSSTSTPKRQKLLQQSLDRLSSLKDSQESHPATDLAMMRVLMAQGKTDQALQFVKSLQQRLDQDNDFPADRPFLPPQDTFEHQSIQGSLTEWLKSTLVKTSASLEKLAANQDQQEISAAPQSETPPAARSKPQKGKIARNAKCPCGSGKKFKICCNKQNSETTHDQHLNSGVWGEDKNTIKHIEPSVLRQPPVKKEHIYDRTDKYLQALIEIKDQSYSLKNLNISELHSFFKMYNVRTDRLTNEWWINFFKVSSQSNSEAEELTEYMIDYTKKLSVDYFKFHEWMTLYFLCLRVGLFHLGYVFRDWARELIINKVKLKNKDLKLKLHAISAYLELQKFQDALDIFSTINPIYYQEPIVKKMMTILNILTDFPLKTIMTESSNEKKFHKFINKKSIAIVGPAQAEEKNANEIDSFDVVIRYKYKKRGMGCDNVFRGSKCDLTYFNKKEAKILFEENLYCLPQDLKWVVFREEGDSLFLRFISAYAIHSSNSSTTSLKGGISCPA